MSRQYQDFVGLNTLIYEPVGWDIDTQNKMKSTPQLTPLGLYEESDSLNQFIGRQNEIGVLSDYSHVLHFYKNDYFPLELPTTASFFNALMSKRGNTYGYPIWRQLRTSNNPLTRRQRKENIFTFVQEPGPRTTNSISRYGSFRKFKEPVVSDTNKPVSLIGEVSIYNDNLNEFQPRSVELKTSFGNETTFFANPEINDYYDTIAETDDNYEELKELYMDGGLEDEGSPIDAFNLFVYRQSVYPKQQYCYLNSTRSRTFFVNSFWREQRVDRTRTSVDGGFGVTIPSQSMWPLDVAEDWADRLKPNLADGVLLTLAWILAHPYNLDTDGDGINDAHQLPIPPVPDFYFYSIGGVSGSTFFTPSVLNGITIGSLGGFNTGDQRSPASYVQGQQESSGAAGILMNSHSQLARGYFGGQGYGTVSPYQPRFVIDSVRDLSNYISASCYYSKRHTINGINSVASPTGMRIAETGSLTKIQQFALFEGLAAWDCATQASEVQGLDKRPFYDSYEKYAEELRLTGKGYTIIPEFKISNHIEKFYSQGITQEVSDIFELEGGLSENSNTSNEDSFYKILSTSDFLKHFDLVKKDHQSLAKESIITLRCKAKKKFLPYEGFYPAQATVNLAKSFYDSYKNNITVESDDLGELDNNQLGVQSILEPFFAPGVLFNTIKSGVAVDYPLTIDDDRQLVAVDHNGTSTVSQDTINSFLFSAGNYDLIEPSTAAESVSFNSIFAKRINFESLVEPDIALKNLELTIQETHPFGLSEADVKIRWDGYGKDLYVKRANNFLAEAVDFFMENSQLKTIVSLEEGDPNFGNVEENTFYAARIKMFRSLERTSTPLTGFSGEKCFAPQTIGARENITMYSRPSAFGIPLYGGDSVGDSTSNEIFGPSHGHNYCFTPPYYYGEAWCDVIFKATQSGKVSLDQILEQCEEYPYYSRFWDPFFAAPVRDLTGYSADHNALISDAVEEVLDNQGNVIQAAQAETGYNISENSKYSGYGDSPWSELIEIDHTNITASSNSISSNNNTIPQLTVTDTGGHWRSPFVDVQTTSIGVGLQLNQSALPPHHQSIVDYNAMQLDASLNLFSKGTVRKRRDDVEDQTIEVASSDTIRGKTRWIIQPKFECPILNFNEYTDLDGTTAADRCTKPQFAAESVPRGMWHQYGKIPTDPSVGVFMQIEDIPQSWLVGGLGLSKKTAKRKVKSLADLVGFSKDPIRLGEVSKAKEISEAVVAVPFVEKNGIRQFFSIPREDIDSCVKAAKREVGPGTFVAGGPPKAGDSVYQMVKMMQKYVFPPSMDFVKYEEVNPFAMYIFEFKHVLSKQDLSDIWQNLSPNIGTRMEEAEATISHELLAHELLGGGAVVKNGTLDDNAEGNGIPSNIQWMIFKAKKRAKTNYFDKIVAKKGTTEDTSNQKLENARGQTGKDLGITYNWPYDFFSLVELVKLDAEVTFGNIENDDKGQKTIKKIDKKNPAEVSKTRAAVQGINIARGKGKLK